MLRILTCLELYNHAEFYAYHPRYKEEWKSPGCSFKKEDSIFTVSLSEETTLKYYNLVNKALNDRRMCVKKEAEFICSLGEWTSFVCILALSSVVNVRIYSYYPRAGDETYRHLFSCKILPRSSTQIKGNVHLLWSRDGNLDNTPRARYSPNHFVPIFVTSTTLNSKISEPLTACISHTKYEGNKSSSAVKNDKEKHKKANSKPSILSSFSSKGTSDSLCPRSTDDTDAIPQSDTRDSQLSLKRQMTDLPSQEISKKSAKGKPDSLPANTTDNTDTVSKSVAGHAQLPMKRQMTDLQAQDIFKKSKTLVRGQPICNLDEVNKNDIGLCVFTGRQFTDTELYHFLSSIWKPPIAFEFPVTIESGKNRKFSSSWLQLYPWLAYSKYVDGCYCIVCALFAQRANQLGSNKLTKLSKEPLTYWTSASSKLKDHQEKSPVHRDCVVLMNHFQQRMKNEIVANKVAQERIKKNREKLNVILDTIVLCGQQDFPLRGHRDESKYYEKQGDNPGNFQALLDYRRRGGDKILEEHFQNCPKNATYHSKTVQNELIECTGAFIVDKIVEEINTSGLFSVLADEVADVSNKEQMALVLRYVDRTGNIMERFIKFVHLNQGTTGRVIADTIKDELRSLGLNLDQCRGQAYDGAGNMSGRYIGAAKLFQDDYPLALYVHCASHRLNLCVAQSCKLLLIKNLFSVMKRVHDFFDWPKRQTILIDTVKEFYPETKQLKVLDVCRTRWVQRVDALNIFESLYEGIFLTLEKIKENVDNTWHSDALTDAEGLFDSISSFKFIVSLVIAQKALGYTRSATVLLQDRAIDIVKGYHEVDLLKATIQHVRKNINEYHSAWFAKAESLASKVGATPSFPRTSGRQTLRENPPANNAEEYYRRALSIPLYDHLLQELDIRFDRSSHSIVKGFVIVPELLLKCVKENGKGAWKKDFKEFANSYKTDLPPFYDIDIEMDIWEMYWSTKHVGVIPARIATTLKTAYERKVTFPAIYRCLCILATIPVTTCECERCISALRRQKTYLRSTLGQDRLNGLAAMLIHRDMEIDFEKVITRFANMHPRRMTLANVLDTDVSK